MLDVLPENFENSNSQYKSIIFKDENNISDYTLRVAFPDKTPFLISSVISLIITSVIFTSIIIIAYITTILLLLRQRQISRIKTDFINNMTHEFKTPIATIKLAIDAIENINLSVIGNIADDDIFHGLWVSPDIDTLTYSLAKIINRENGWGLSDESFNSLSMLSKLNEDTWMTLGDKDFGLHIYRTMRRNSGSRPSDIAKDISNAFGIKSNIILPTDDIVQTKLLTSKGWMNFQEYFVKEKCKPKISSIKFEGIEKALPTKECIGSIQNADLIILAPSNPLVSLNPIIQLPGIREILTNANAPKISISPFIGNKTIKGPANK